jgi:hypothetical protein
MYNDSGFDHTGLCLPCNNYYIHRGAFVGQNSYFDVEQNNSDTKVDKHMGPRGY